jgi:hypothetical protein
VQKWYYAPFFAADGVKFQKLINLEMKWSVSFWKTFCKYILSQKMSWLHHVHLTFVTLAQYFLRVLVFENMKYLSLKLATSSDTFWITFVLHANWTWSSLDMYYVRYVLCHVTVCFVPRYSNNTIILLILIFCIENYGR